MRFKGFFDSDDSFVIRKEEDGPYGCFFAGFLAFFLISILAPIFDLLLIPLIVGFISKRIKSPALSAKILAIGSLVISILYFLISAYDAFHTDNRLMVIAMCVVSIGTSLYAFFNSKKRLEPIDMPVDPVSKEAELKKKECAKRISAIAFIISIISLCIVLIFSV